MIGLISAAGGTHGLQAINTMEFATRALRGWAVPYVVPVPTAARVFDRDGQVQDAAIEAQLRSLGAEVVRVAQRFAADPALHRMSECDEATERLTIDSPQQVGTALVSIDFTGTLNDKLRGWYRSTYPADDGTERVAAAA